MPSPSLCRPASSSLFFIFLLPYLSHFGPLLLLYLCFYVFSVFGVLFVFLPMVPFLSVLCLPYIICLYYLFPSSRISLNLNILLCSSLPFIYCFPHCFLPCLRFFFLFHCLPFRSALSSSSIFISLIFLLALTYPPVLYISSSYPSFLFFFHNTYLSFQL